MSGIAADFVFGEVEIEVHGCKDMAPLPATTEDHHPAMTDSALVLFSGGQDSTTCLAWALDRYLHVETIGFAYGQRHIVELDCRAPLRSALAAEWPGRLGADHTINLAVTVQD